MSVFSGTQRPRAAPAMLLALKNSNFYWLNTIYCQRLAPSGNMDFLCNFNIDINTAELFKT